MKLWKRIWTIIGIICIIIALIIIAIPTWVVYVSVFEKTELCRYISPDEEYNVIVYEIGDASWPFGPVKAQMKAVDRKGKTVAKCEFWVYNDGTNLELNNITSIVWLKSRVEITIRHFDGMPTTTYWLPLPED